MRILAISDAMTWRGYGDIISEARPDIIALAGDLVYDPFCKDCTNGIDYHASNFYRFLETESRKARILIIRGNHDENHAGFYDHERIARIPNCMDISGSMVQAGGLRILGLGFSDTHLPSRLKPLLEEHRGKADIILTHCEQKMLPIVSSFRPKLIIRGHYGYGKYLVDGIPTVMTSSWGRIFYTLIDIKEDQLNPGTILPAISQYTLIDGRIDLLENSVFPVPAYKDKEFQLYPWLAPYPSAET